MKLETQVKKIFHDLFPINRSLTGKGNDETFLYLQKYFLNSEIKSIPSGTKVYDWTVPDEWDIKDGYVINSDGIKIIDFNESNLHVMSYSESINKTVGIDELMSHLHTLPEFPDWIPYRTSYYNKNWGFCSSHKLTESHLFKPPFKVFIDSRHNENGNLKWLECVKKGKKDREILISTYCCHPSMANDNLSGIVLAICLYEFLNKKNTNYTYRFLIAPETIGTISFLSKTNLNLIDGGMVLSNVAGPGKISIKNSFNENHFMNISAHLALQKHMDDDYLKYPFSPNGSDERQYSSPGIRIVTPSIHKSKYQEYNEYHTSADNLNFIKPEFLVETFNVYKTWINLIESHCIPKRKIMQCEFQLGKYNLYPNIGGKIGQRAYSRNNKQEITNEILCAFSWLMHLSDGTNSNFDISKKSGIDIMIINEAISMMHQNDLLDL